MTNLYILWALSNTNIKIESSQIEYALEISQSTEDPYILALIANVLYNVDKREEGFKILQRLADKSSNDGFIDGAKTSITYSRDNSLRIETTSLAVLGWIREPHFTEYTYKAIEWISSQCKNGLFGSTQSTILALKAIIAFDLNSASNLESGGKVDLMLDGELIHTESFSKEQIGSINFPTSIAKFFAEGTHDVNLLLSFTSSTSTQNRMTYSLHIEQFANTPSNKNSDLSMTTSLFGDRLIEGSSTLVNVKIHRESRSEGMIVAVIPLPAGLRPWYEKLQELVKTEKISFFELNGNEVIFYWNNLPRDYEIDLNFEVIAEIPGHFVAKAARAYYYYADSKYWTQGLRVLIDPVGFICEDCIL